MFTKDGKHITLPTHIGKVKILYHILKAKVKFSVIRYRLSIISCGF